MNLVVHTGFLSIQETANGADGKNLLSLMTLTLFGPPYFFVLGDFLFFFLQSTSHCKTLSIQTTNALQECISNNCPVPMLDYTPPII